MNGTTDLTATSAAVAGDGYDPAFLAITLPMPHAAKIWEAHFTDYARFLDREGRVPRYRSEEPDERRLAAWAAKQRHAYKHERLDEARVEKLNSLPIRVLPSLRRPK